MLRPSVAVTILHDLEATVADNSVVPDHEAGCAIRRDGAAASLRGRDPGYLGPTEGAPLKQR